MKSLVSVPRCLCGSLLGLPPEVQRRAQTWDTGRTLLRTGMSARRLQNPSERSREPHCWRARANATGVPHRFITATGCPRGRVWRQASLPGSEGVLPAARQTALDLSSCVR